MVKSTKPPKTGQFYVMTKEMPVSTVFFSSSVSSHVSAQRSPTVPRRSQQEGQKVTESYNAQVQGALICGKHIPLMTIHKKASQPPRRMPSDDSRTTPVWYQAASPLGSAVHYLASLSPRFNWVGIYLLKGKYLELGPFIGAPSEHTRIAIGQGVCGTAVAENLDQNVADVRSHGNYLACSLETRSELVVLIRDSTGKILGQIDIDSHTTNAFGEDEEKWVKQVANDLGGLWPE